MSRRPPQDERDVLLAIADVVADGSDLTDEEVFTDLEAMGVDGRHMAATGAQRVKGLLNRQRLSWQSDSRVRTARAVSLRQPRPTVPRGRPELLALVKARQSTGTRVDWHKLGELTNEQLEGLLADDDLASALDRLADDTETSG